MLNVYEQVSQNKYRSFLIIILFGLFISFVFYLIFNDTRFGPSFLIYALPISALSSFASFYFGDQIVLSLNRARPADKKEFYDFYTVTRHLSEVNQTPVPKIYVIDSPALNAFATGRSPDHASVCATTGLLAKLDRRQIEAVIAHELSHIKNYDTLLMMIVSLLVGSLSLLVRTGAHSSYSSNRKNSQNPLVILGIIAIVLSPIIAGLIKLAISRRREFFADALAVKLTRRPQELISALQTISQDQNILQTASTATASLYIDNPFKTNKIATLFATHPPIEKRIEALQKML